ENITNYEGGGIYCGDSTPSLINIIISENSATGIYGSGGGIYFDNSSSSLENVTISENYANYYGGGIYFKESITYFDSINRCNIFLNNASYVGNLGNDLYAFDCPPINVIVDTFTILQPYDYYAYPIDNYTFEILHCKIEQVNQDLYVSPNGSDDNSGLTPTDPLLTISYALTKIMVDSTNPHIIHLDSGNYSPSQTGESFPLYCRSYVSLEGENENTTILDGEGLSGILYCYDDNYFSIRNMTIQNGNAQFGGGIFCESSSPDITNVIISDNTANNGGGIYYWSNSSSSLTNVTISGNTANRGGGIYSKSSSQTLTNVTISENNANDFGGGIFCINNSNQYLSNCILWNDSPQEVYFKHVYSPNTITISYSDVQGGEAGIVTNNNGTVNWLYGNIDADPLFADPENGDFHLTWANFPIPDSTMSPCIDAGDPDSPLDPDSTRTDMGAFYFDQSQQEVEDTPTLPTKSLIYQNYPNPFSTSTTISFFTTKNTNGTKIKIYNIKGQLVRTHNPMTNDKCPMTNVVWDGKDENGNLLSSGIYFYKLEVGDKIIDTKKCLLLK
ncbi:MAG: T9SS type A sorting domain-containing protein, partial [Candidatus Cloacimonetes bacterium]|nr:T9SS type A sorting domain-containing protein [Candidatus Cloacimonadota bacterium]